MTDHPIRHFGVGVSECSKRNQLFQSGCSDLRSLNSVKKNNNQKLCYLNKTRLLHNRNRLERTLQKKHRCSFFFILADEQQPCVTLAGTSCNSVVFPCVIDDPHFFWAKVYDLQGINMVRGQKVKKSFESIHNKIRCGHLG